MANIIIPFIQCLSQVLTANLGHILAVPSAEAGLEHFRWRTFPNVSFRFYLLATHSICKTLFDWALLKRGAFFTHIEHNLHVYVSEFVFLNTCLKVHSLRAF